MAFTNRDRLRKRLKAIPVEARKAVRTQLRANAQELAEMQRRLVPVDTMVLHDSIKWRDVSNSTRIAVRNTAGSAKAYYVRFVEFGSASREAIPSRPLRRGGMSKAWREHHGSSAQPFFWPSYRALKKKMKRKAAVAGLRAIRLAVKK